MAEPTESDRARAGELCKLTGCDCGGTGAIAREVTRAEHGCDGDERRCASVCPVEVQDVDYDACELHAHFASALAEAREEGERAGSERARRACWEIAEGRRMALSLYLIGAVLPGLALRAHEAANIRDAIAALGPMGERRG